MSDYLIHHGILGQKWGVRRYQNEDGSLTAAGKKRYLNGKKGRELLKNDINETIDKNINAFCEFAKKWYNDHPNWSGTFPSNSFEREIDRATRMLEQLDLSKNILDIFPEVPNG